DVLDLLTALVEKSLVIFSEGDGEPRYRVLETIRQYARERLEANGEADAVREQHSCYFLDRAKELTRGLRRAEGAAKVGRLECEHGNLRAALAWCRETPSAAQRGLELATQLSEFWDYRGYVAEGRAHLEATLASAAGDENPAGRARALHS